MKLSSVGLWAALVAACAAQAAPTVHLGLFSPDNMAFDAAGHVILIDTDHAAQSRILKLTPEGRILADWRVFSAPQGHNKGPYATST